MRSLFLLGLISYALMVTNVYIFEYACGKKPIRNGRTNSLLPENAEVTNSAQQQKVKWIPANYRGLKLGQSTYQDVKKIFGEPNWEGQNEENTFDEDSETEILLQYNNQGAGKEAADIVIGEKTRIVKAISVVPYPEMTRQEAIEKFGIDYFEISSGESICLNGNQKRGASERKLNYPVLLVYPEKGMYVSINSQNKVMHTGYLYKCLLDADEAR
jgi:hypothetical protein